MNGTHRVPLLALDTVFSPDWAISCINAVYEYVMADYTLDMMTWAEAIKDINVAKLEVMRTRYVNTQV